MAPYQVFWFAQAVVGRALYTKLPELHSEFWICIELKAHGVLEVNPSRIIEDKREISR